MGNANEVMDFLFGQHELGKWCPSDRSDIQEIHDFHIIWHISIRR